MLGKIYYTELLKLKRSALFLVIFIAAIFPVVISFFPMYIANKYNNESFSWSLLFTGDLAFLNLIIGIPLFSLIVGYVFSREYSLKTSNQLFAYPVSRIWFLIGKLLVTFTIIVFTVTLSFITVLLFGFVGSGNLIAQDQMKNFILAYGLTILLQFLLVPVSVVVSLWMKNMIAPIVLAVLCVTISGVGLSSKYALLFPWAIPTRIIFDAVNYGEYASFPYLTSLMCLLSFFVLSLIFCIYYLRNADIDAAS